MRFLADLNAGGPVTRWLRGAGHDVIEVANRDFRMGDDAILEWAFRDDRIVITTDPDFEELIYRRGYEHRGILRLENLPRARRLRLLENVMRDYAPAIAGKLIVIAKESKVRVRRR